MTSENNQKCKFPRKIQHNQLSQVQVMKKRFYVSFTAQYMNTLNLTKSIHEKKSDLGGPTIK